MYKSIVLEKIDNEVLAKINRLQLNGIFAKLELLTKESVQQIKDALGSDVEIHAVLDCFEGKELLEKFPQAKAVEAFGKDTVSESENYYPVSPVNTGVKNYLLGIVANISSDLQINTLWLNKLQFPTKWNVKDPIILDTDYSDAVLAEFAEIAGAEIEGENLEEKQLAIDGLYYHEWLSYKTGKINQFAKDVKQKLQDNNINIKLGFFAVPWKDKDYGSGINRILGQDFENLTQIFDEFAVMMYQKDLGEDAAWISETVEYFWNLGQLFLSNVQYSEDMSDFKEPVSKFPSKGVLVSGVENADDSTISKLSGFLSD